MSTAAEQAGDILPVYTPGDLPAQQQPGTPGAIRLGVIGNPIAHSRSPQMQQAALNSAALPFTYVRLLAGTAPGEFEQLLEQLARLDFIGVNVTVPFKKNACAAAVQTDSLSRLCGAANTLVRRADGWHAYNTDGPGFATAIQERLGRPLSELKVLLCGACGGAGSALACQCALSGCPSITLVNRPRPQLTELADKLRSCGHSHVHTLHFDSPELPAAVQAADLIVNATSLGLHEQDPMPLPPEWLRPGQMVCDIVPHSTAFCRAAAARGCTAEDGAGMLLHQGAIAFSHWFNQPADIPAMRAGLSADGH